MAARGQWFFPIFDQTENLAQTTGAVLMFFSVFHQVDFLAPRAAVALGFDSDVFLVSRQPAGGGFFPFLIGSNFGSESSRGPVVFLSFSPGEMPMWRGGFLAPRAAVVVCPLPKTVPWETPMS